MGIGNSFAQNPGYQGKHAFLEYQLDLNYTRLFQWQKGMLFHNLQFGYIAFRKTIIGLNYEINNSSDTYSGGNQQEFEITNKVNAIGINFDFYMGNSIAPVGSYWRIGYKRISAKVTDEGTDFGDESATANYLAFGLGTRRVIADKVIFNVGGELGYAFNNTELSNLALTDLYLYRIHIGLGWLLF